MPSLYDEGKINEVEEVLNIHFSNKFLLERALTHKSFPNENKELNMKDNERLEFLGDSVLSLTVSTYIFKKFPDYPEGKLAKMRSVIVSEPILAKIAREINIGKYMLLGNGEELTGGRDRESIMADAMEAIFGAIYMDRGFEIAAEFILSILVNVIDAVENGKYIKDYKTMLQELIQKDNLQRPEYKVIDEKGPDHNKTFTINVNFNGKRLGKGKGSSKKEAEQKAAKEALKKLGKL